MSEYILIANEAKIATITLNRPDKRNALNGQMIKELLHALTRLREDNDVRVLLLKGQGDHFCAGADIHWMQQIAAGPHGDNEIDALMLADLMYHVYSFPKPTIALAQGSTMGGGLGLLCACDITIGAENSNFGFSEVKIGIAPSVISPYAIAAIGERMAHYYFLTGERFSALDAKRIGLLHQVVDDELLLQAGKMLANTILQNGPQALMATKQLIRYVAKSNISPELSQKTAEHLANLRMAKEAQEGLQAFIEKRRPVWE
jgi:methylglutaconyl-CoA hydratase